MVKWICDHIWPSACSADKKFGFMQSNRYVHSEEHGELVQIGPFSCFLCILIVDIPAAPIQRTSWLRFPILKVQKTTLRWKKKTENIFFNHLFYLHCMETCNGLGYFSESYNLVGSSSYIIS